MSQFKDLNDPITAALLYAELGMDDAQIAQELKEDEGIEDEKDMDFIFEIKKKVTEKVEKLKLCHYPTVTISFNTN